MEEEEEGKEADKGDEAEEEEEQGEGVPVDVAETEEEDVGGGGRGRAEMAETRGEEGGEMRRKRRGSECEENTGEKERNLDLPFVFTSEFESLSFLPRVVSGFPLVFSFGFVILLVISLIPFLFPLKTLSYSPFWRFLMIILSSLLVESPLTALLVLFMLLLMLLLLLLLLVLLLVFPLLNLVLRLGFGCGEGGGSREKAAVFVVILFGSLPTSFLADSPTDDAGIGEGVGVGEREGGGETDGEGGRSVGDRE